MEKNTTQPGDTGNTRPFKQREDAYCKESVYSEFAVLSASNAPKLVHILFLRVLNTFVKLKLTCLANTHLLSHQPS